MAKSSNQKLKLMYLKDMLNKNTDENHGITITEIIQNFSKYNINAERKSIYDDLENLRLYGEDIIGRQEKGKYTYHMLNRVFELPELKLLVDAVQASKFITAKKSKQLIKKLSTFTSIYEADQLQRHVHVAGRVKTMNESIYYNVDKIHLAILSDSKINFLYFEWSMDKKMKPRRNGAIYLISPWGLCWDNENYYMIAYDSKEEKIKHYRVDKMLAIELTDLRRDGKEEFSSFDTAIYANKMFSMYGGIEENVKLEFENNLVGVVIDRFGKELSIIPKGDNHFTVNVNAVISKQFLAWVFGLGRGVKIISPENVVEQMRVEAKRLAEQYL